MRASIHDVAARAGVSTSTVSRTLSKPDLVLPSTRRKVLAAARALEYHVSRSAASLKSGQTMRIALLANGHITSWFNANIFAGLDGVFHSHGYDISVFPMNDADQRHEFFEDLPVRRNADAVVVSSFNIDVREIDKLKDMNVPLIGVNVPSQEGFDAAVGIDDSAAMHMAVEYLISLGHRHITYAYSTPNHSHRLQFSADARLNGFLESCERHPDVAPATLGVDDGTDTTTTILDYLADASAKPTALCLQNDDMALPLLFRMRQYGYRIPQDMSIVGFDDIPFAGSVGLTTIRQNPYELGSAAARKTLALMEGHACEPAFETQQVQLILRETTASA